MSTVKPLLLHYGACVSATYAGADGVTVLSCVSCMTHVCEPVCVSLSPVVYDADELHSALVGAESSLWGHTRWTEGSALLQQLF